MSTIDEATAKYPDRTRHCPMCGSHDVDFGSHGAMTAGATVLCNGCGYTESGGDADSLYLRWTRP
jgi:transcription elongation factor Elf1